MFKSLFQVAAIALLASILPAKGYAQTPGCRDPLANNYNASATVNDGSCTYNQTSYTPPIKVDPISALLEENSGLQWAAGHLWTFNDGGGAAAIYRIDTLSNAILQTVNIAGATNVDWEDIAFDGSHFYIGDFGNNANGARTDLKIYKFPLSAIPEHNINPVVTIPASEVQVINFIYSDQPQPPVATAPNATPFDCEAMIVDNGMIHLFTKNWVSLTSTHYVISSTLPGTYIALPLETLNTGYLVTAADKAVGEEIVTLIGYVNAGTAAHYMHILSDYSSGNYFNGNKRRIDLPDALTMGQVEGITFRNGTYGYISNEKFTRTSGPFTLTVNQKLRSFNTSDFVASYVLPAELHTFAVANKNNSHQLTWKFNAPVQQLEVQASPDGVQFSQLQKLATATTGSLLHKPEFPINYYRLAWKNTDQSANYSKTVVARREKENSFNNIAITKNGEISFTNTTSSAVSFSFKIVTADGKVVAEVPVRSYSPGRNRLQIKAAMPLSGVVALTITTDRQAATQMIFLQ
ncbi:hypothetical protein [Aridibaculum aurantiacum]|uniref:hypothetical protein n=1 Tax=Aridibaculum aurantiacum TaxID=2810307 RepID=UPI001A977335|nr:hypothetical protein [Aridibaculum aurantiacum]